MTTPEPVPEQAVIAAQAVLQQAWGTSANARQRAIATLEAAAPAIRAAERERIRQLATDHQAHYHSCGVPCSSEHSERPFADLLK